MFWPVVFAFSVVLLGCSDSRTSSGEEMFGFSDSDDSYGGVSMEEPSPDSGDSENDPDDGLGSEDESNFLGLRPGTTNEYVFVVNTDRDTVTRIAVPSLEVITTVVGTRPSVVLTASDHSTAVTFNVGSDDVSIIDAHTLEVTNVSVRPNLNQMAMSPDGRWVICYHDVDSEVDGASGSGSISYNEISIVDLETFSTYETVVGAFPHDVQFTDDSANAVVISDDYLAAITLDESGPETLRIPITDETIDPPEAEEVLLDPEGQYAIVRQYGVDSLVLVDLVTEVTELLDVGDNPTDMDLSPDGSEAFVVARGSAEIWIYDMLDPTASADVIAMPEGSVFGSLLMSPDDTQGLLYSTVSGMARYGVWDRSTDEVTTRSLVKPVSGVGVSPLGNTALVFHSLSNGDIDVSSPFYNHYGLTLIDLSDFFANPIQLAAEPTAHASAADGGTGYFIMEGEPYLGVLDYDTLIHDMQPLPSDPVYLGVLPDTNLAYISQVHELGRISFYDSDDSVSPLQTVTGFELNSAIEE